jgi:AraC-like DNA-binding protein
LQHYESTDFLSVMTVRQTILQLICSILQLNNIPPISLNRKSPLVEKALAYIHTNLRITLTIGEISNHLFVSESKLRSAFLAETGITVGQYIDNQVHAWAKKLLSGTQLSIGEISTQLGFCDQFYFLKAGCGYSYGGIDTVTSETLAAVYGIQAQVLDVQGRKTVIIE